MPTYESGDTKIEKKLKNWLHSIKVKQQVIPLMFRLSGCQDLYAKELSEERGHCGVEITMRSSACTIEVPAVVLNNPSTPRKETILPAKSVDYNPRYVMRLNYATHGDCVKRWGAIVLSGRRALHTGVNYHMARMAALFSRPWEGRRREELIVAP